MRNFTLFVVVSLALMFTVGCSAPSFLVTPVPSGNTLDEQTVKDADKPFADKVALIEVEGMLVNARTGGFLQAQENKLSLFTQQMEAAEKDP
ncbi:MAG TPA: hypothetical protein VGJ21_03265, partial [Terracidiphilus sp.]